jgi:hypothetical protein
MLRLSETVSFEHGPNVVYLNALRSVVDGWTVRVTIVGRRREHLPAVTELAAPTEPARFATPAEALAEGTRLARAHLLGS